MLKARPSASTLRPKYLYRFWSRTCTCNQFCLRIGGIRNFLRLPVLVTGWRTVLELVPVIVFARPNYKEESCLKLEGLLALTVVRIRNILVRLKLFFIYVFISFFRFNFYDRKGQLDKFMIRWEVLAPFPSI